MFVLAIEITGASDLEEEQGTTKSKNQMMNPFL